MAQSNRRTFLKKTGLGLLATSAGFKSLEKHSLQADLTVAKQSTDLNTPVNDSIAKNRMEDVVIELKDNKGQPVRQKTVDIRMQQHAFLFGDHNVQLDRMYRQGDGYDQKIRNYQHLYAQVLNSLNATCYWTERPKHDMKKTQQYQGDINLESFDRSVNWANANGLTAKGHPLFWPVPKALPQWLTKYPYTTQMKFVETRLRNMVARYKGKVKYWDVVNEALWEPALKNLDQRKWPYLETLDNMVEYIAPLIKWCKEEDPETKLIINDYGLSTNVKDNLKTEDGQLVDTQLQRKRYLDLIRKLSDKGYPPDGIGVQCHFDPLNEEEQQALYEELGQVELPIYITEFNPGEEWIQNKDHLSQEEIRQKQFEYTKQFMQNAFGNKHVAGFYFWGFMGLGVDFREGLSPSYNLTPFYHKIKELITGEWHTQKTLTTDENGRIRFKGFRGDYTLRYQIGNKGYTTGHRFRINEQNGKHVMLQGHHL